MKRIVIFIISVLLPLVAASQNTTYESFKRWHADKYSMFIHFGLYSHLGGVWEGKPVTEGYSEQIQSFAGIFGDWYAMTADYFDPKSFDAAEIVDLAKKAGMRSIVFTSKHHDGFCMFDTSTTEYDSVDRTPSGRDYVRELSDACAQAGMKFGLYFSLIDWNYPYAYPISSHNADFVTPQHHEFNKSQVRELLTNYGPISELWFDMGSLCPGQSKDLYELVKQIQPDCMVSGRLGNDVYDFAVMADNKLPDVALHAPWQSAASMFPETWSYRSWQERGEVDAKVAEKLRSLIDVVSRGGNYLLNVGPDPTGAVVPFEREVLLKIGAWLDKNGDAIYGSEPSPFPVEFEWGDVTVKGREMYLFLTGKYPQDGKVRLPLTSGESVVEVTPQMYADPADVHVIMIKLEDSQSRKVAAVEAETTLSRKNATPDYSYSCFDYYSNYRSVVAYNWMIENKKAIRGVRLGYALSDAGKRIDLQVGDKSFEVTLENGAGQDMDADVSVISRSVSRMRGGIFDRPVSMNGLEWTELDSAYVRSADRPFANHLMKVVLKARRSCRVNLSILAGNGVELLVYDKNTGECTSLMKHLNPYRSTAFAENVLVDLERGENTLILRSYNRFERELNMGLELEPSQQMFLQTIDFDSPIRSHERVSIRVTDAAAQSEHADCKLHNLTIKLIY